MINLDKPEPLSPGPACNANAFVGQFSVQAVDFNILIMSITVLFTLRTRRLSAEPSRLTITSLCALAWVPSIITSTSLDLPFPCCSAPCSTTMFTLKD